MKVLDCTGNVFTDPDGIWPGTMKVPKITDDYQIAFSSSAGSFTANYGKFGIFDIPMFKPSIAGCE